jgi:hypothetical protein
MLCNIRRTFAACTLTLVAAIVTCGCSASTKPVQPPSTSSEAESNEAAKQVGLILSTGGAPGAALSSFVARRATAFAAVPNTLPQASPVETTVTTGSVTWKLAIQWYDAQGLAQPAYDPQTTVRAHVDALGTGRVTRTDGSTRIGAAGTFDVLGVDAQSSKLTANGSNVDTLVYTVQEQTGPVTVTALAAGALADVVEMKPVAGNYPASGTGTWDVTLTRRVGPGDGPPSERFRGVVVVTFNGTHLVPLVVNGTWRFILDLNTGKVLPPRVS